MATCNKCGNTYLTRTCLKCEEKEKIQQFKNNRIKTAKKEDTITIKKINIQYIIASALVIMALVMVYKEYKDYRQEQEVLKLLYGTSDYDKISKINDKIRTETNKQIKQSNEMIKQFNIQNQKMIEKQKEMYKKLQNR